jgi:hypothetical protein
MIKKIVIAIVSFMICTNGVSTERVQVEINADTELYSIQVPQDMLPRMRPLGRVFQNLQELTLTSNNGIKIPSRLTPVIEGYLTTTKIIPDSILHNELVELISEQVGEDFNFKTIVGHDDIYTPCKVTYPFQIRCASAGLVIKVNKVTEEVRCASAGLVIKVNEVTEAV